MPTLRMFAQAREASGVPTDQFDGVTVGEILDAASTRYGPGFSAVLPICAVWVNGDPADRSQSVVESDEVAVLPPVSGGCG